jgi:hypothetical protein
MITKAAAAPSWPDVENRFVVQKNEGRDKSALFLIPIVLFDIGGATAP